MEGCSIDVICIDKTGVLTEDKFEINEIFFIGDDPNKIQYENRISHEKIIFDIQLKAENSNNNNNILN